MAILAPEQPTDFPAKKRTALPMDEALAFLHSIESAWKGFEHFAMWLVQRTNASTVVDIGFDRGFSTLAFAYKNRGDVFGVDWFEEGGYAAKSFALDSAFRNISLAIRHEYAKNIHLIIGPFSDVSRKWTRKIDILHIGLAYTYYSVKKHYAHWHKYLKPGGVFLLDNVLEHPAGAGRFFDEQPLPKWVLPHGCGLGVISEDAQLIEEIRQEWGVIHHQ